MLCGIGMDRGNNLRQHAFNDECFFLLVVGRFYVTTEGRGGGQSRTSVSSMLAYAPKPQHAKTTNAAPQPKASAATYSHDNIWPSVADTTETKHRARLASPIIGIRGAPTPQNTECKVFWGDSYVSRHLRRAHSGLRGLER